MKILVPLLLLITCPFNLSSQSINIGISGGYNIPIASSFNSINNTEFENQTFPYYYSTYRKLVYTSYGKGGNLALNMEWYSQKNIGCGAIFNLLFSSPFSCSEDVIYLSGTTATFHYTDKPFSFQFIPHLNFKYDFKKVSPYLHLGMLISATHIYTDYTAENNLGTQIKSSVNIHGNAMLGFYSSLGVAVKISKAVSFTAALTCSAGSYSPAKWDRISYFVNGNNNFANLVTSSKQGIYVKELNLSAPQPNYLPSESLKFSLPFSNVGINAGFLFVIPIKKAATKDQIERRRKIKEELKTNYF